MKHTILLILLIPTCLFAQFSRTANSSAAATNPTPVMKGTTAADIKVSVSNDPFAFPLKAALNVYPNPAVSHARAVFTSGDYGLEYHLSMISLDGKPLLQRKGVTVKGTNIINLEMGSFPMGTYFVQLLVGQKRETLQFIKIDR